MRRVTLPEPKLFEWEKLFEYFELDSNIVRDSFHNFSKFAILGHFIVDQYIWPKFKIRPYIFTCNISERDSQEWLNVCIPLDDNGSMINFLLSPEKLIIESDLDVYFQLLSPLWPSERRVGLDTNFGPVSVSLKGFLCYSLMGESLGGPILDMAQDGIL